MTVTSTYVGSPGWMSASSPLAGLRGARLRPRHGPPAAGRGGLPISRPIWSRCWSAKAAHIAAAAGTGATRRSAADQRGRCWPNYPNWALDRRRIAALVGVAAQCPRRALHEGGLPIAVRIWSLWAQPGDPPPSVTPTVGAHRLHAQAAGHPQRHPQDQYPLESRSALLCHSVTSARGGEGIAEVQSGPSRAARPRRRR